MSYKEPAPWITADPKYVEFAAEFDGDRLLGAYVAGHAAAAELVCVDPLTLRFQGWHRDGKVSPDLFGHLDVPMHINTDGWARTLLVRKG